MPDLLQRVAKFQRTGKDREALRLLQGAAGQRDASASVHLQYAFALDRMSREARAIHHYTRALSLGLPSNDRADCLICLASSYRNKKRHAAALSTIEQAVREFPNNEVVVFFHALILSDVGRAHEGLALVGEMSLRRLQSPELERFRDVLLSRYKSLKKRDRAASRGRTPRTER
jgi:tetratricopeptide (TPR) repeat protein